MGLLLVYTSTVIAVNPNLPTELHCFDKTNPVGVGQLPYFGWQNHFGNSNEIQTAYQILISSSLQNIQQNTGDIWDSGKIQSGSQNYNYCTNAKLKAATEYYWKVRTWNKQNEAGAYSVPAKFSTGLFDFVDWNGAKWIKRDNKDAEDYSYFRKSFQLSEKSIKRAIVYISACHSYELYLNNKFIGKGFFHHYPQFSYYHAIDITNDLIKQKKNVFACLTHWYGGGQGRATGARGLLFKTIIEYTDNTTETIVSDGSWKTIQAKQWKTNQPKRNGEGVGFVEMVDSRNVMADWYKLNIDDINWTSATEIGTHPTKPWTGNLRPDLTRVIEQSISPVSVKNIGNGKTVIDLGKIYSGSFKINFEGGKPGDTIKMSGGFVLEKDGTVSHKINQGTNLDFVYVLNGKESIFCPYVYFGMRYLQVQNAPCKLTKNNVSFIFRHFELDPSESDFSSSSPMLNKVWDLMKHSLLLGAQEDFVDTPTREKGAFLGDGWSQSSAALTTMYDRTMSLRAINQFINSQDQYWSDGRINAVYPNVDGKRDIPDFTQSFLVWIWDYYMQTGNLEFLKSNYQRLKKIADYVDTCRNDSTGLVNNLKGGRGAYEYGIIDWPETMRYGYDMKTEARTVINMYAYADFEIMSEIAKAVDVREDVRIYTEKANRLKLAINSYLINSDGVYADGLRKNGVQSKHVSQHANMMPLALGIVPDANYQKVVQEVKNKKMNVGMVALRWLPQSLGEAGEGQHLLDLYTNINWDGWAKTIASGGTATWESWDADSTNQSMSHPWGVVGLLGIQQYILGIKALKPQNEMIQIKPLFFGDNLTWAKGTYPTDRGNVTVSWKFLKGKYTLKVQIPDNVTANIYIPKCGKTGNQLKVNNTVKQGIESQDYIELNNIGSGSYLIER